MIRWKHALAWLLLAASAAAQSPTAADRREFVEPHMGTLFRIVLYATDANAARAAARAAFDSIAALNRALSDYDPTSELSRLGQQPPHTAVPLSPELFDILQRSQVLAEKTHGAFDVTLGPTIRLWRESRRTQKLPTDSARSAALQACGFAHLRLDPTARTATLLRPGMALDLGGIAKGYAADEALAVLERHGFTHAMVAASGDLALGDAPPGKSGWTVELAPFGATTGTVLVANAAVSTSADTAQFVEIGGTRYSHIVDPKTGLGLTKSTAVTVITRHATLSDGLATACSVLDLADAKNLVETWLESVRVIVHQRNADGSVQSTTFGRAPAGLFSPP